MKTLTPRTLLTTVLLVGTTFFGCKKEDEEPVVIKTYVAAFLQNLEAQVPGTRIRYDLNNLLLGGAELYVWSSASGYGDEIELSDNVPYSFTLEKTVNYSTPTTTTYTGTVARAAFTNTSNNSSDPNRLTISVANSLPTLTLNGVRLPAPTPATTGGGTGGSTGGGSNTCPLGTWQTPTCNGAAGKFLVYNFGPGGVGYSENPDCNGICTSMKFNFRYTVSGNTITYTFTGTDDVVCNGTTRPGPAVNTTTPYSITYTCGNNGNQLVTESVNLATGVRTTLTFARR